MLTVKDQTIQSVIGQCCKAVPGLPFRLDYDLVVGAMGWTRMPPFVCISSFLRQRVSDHDASY